LTRQLIRPILHLQPIPLSVIRLLVIRGLRDWKAIPALLPAIPVLKVVQDLMEWAMTVLTALVLALALMVSAAVPMVPALMVPALMVPALVVLVAPGPAEVPAATVPVLAAELMVAAVQVPVRAGPMVLAAELMVAMVAAATVADARLSHS
jgi:hypothetical protein